ncbi:hypothetical protein B0H13DRAFT_1072644 [Mycena leptocephala]|nr:hypothetical protein B0H13DRAFT_1072644 [Mycena leptocephala]
MEAVSEGRRPFKAVATGKVADGSSKGCSCMNTPSRPPLYEPPCARSSAGYSGLPRPPLHRFLTRRVRARVSSDSTFLPTRLGSSGATPTLFHRLSPERAPPLGCSPMTSTARRLPTAPAIRCINLQGRCFGVLHAPSCVDGGYSVQTSLHAIDRLQRLPRVLKAFSRARAG